VLDALASVARDARVAADLTQLDIATAAKVSHATISRFERAEGWPQDVGAIIDAYETECGLRPGTLWKLAAEKL